VERINKLVGGAVSSSFESPNNQPKEQNKSAQATSSYGRGSSYNSDSKQPYPRRRKGVRTDLTLIKGILSKALAGKGIDKKIERYEFVLHWEKIVGQKLAEVTKPEYISRKTLIVRVLHPVWAQECAFMKAQLLRKLAPYLKRGDVVDDMIFRVGSLAE
jgi:predicted nucleic acid-binding Zn ribbon protein